jgi:hypothetical protein
MTRTVEELQQQVIRLRGYMSHFKNRMEGCISTLQRTSRDLSILLSEESKQMPIAELRGVLTNARARIEAVVSAPPGVRLDVEAVEAAPELLGKHAIVMYFETQEDADEIAASIQAAKPGMRSVAIAK